MKPYPVPRELVSFPSRFEGASKVVFALGDLSDAPRVVAIVGARRASEHGLAFAAELAAACARAGVVVASGGALGIDSKAHTAALDAGGRTWAILPTGPLHLYPKENPPLFERIALDGGALVWPFRPPTDPNPIPNYFARNRVLAAIADAVVVVEGELKSGTRNTARCARAIGTPLWVVAPPPWVRGFEGNRAEIDLGGARPLMAIEPFLESLGPNAPPWRRRERVSAGQQSLFGPPCVSAAYPAALRRAPGAAPEPLRAAPSRPLNPEEKRLVDAAETTPRHLDQLLERAGLPPGVAASALLTLVLEHVLVEGPAGHYRRPP